MRSSLLLFQRQELVTTNVELVACLERGGLDAFLWLDGEVDLVDRSQDLVDLADGSLAACQSSPGSRL